MDLTVAQILALLKDGGIVALLVLILMGGSRRFWVWGWQYDQVCKERDVWREMALAGTTTAERLATLAERGVK